MFSRGDVVNVTIKGVRYVRHEQPDGALTVQTNDPDEHLWALPPQAAIERVAPKEYPVQAGDIWTNPLGYEWVGKADGDLVGVDTGDRRTFDQVNKSSGPLTLVRRRGWSPEQPAEQDKTEQAEPVTLADLTDLINLHIGPGGNPELAIEDAQGVPQPVTDIDLGVMLTPGGSSRYVLLRAEADNDE